MYCGNIGIIPVGKEFKKVSPGDIIVAAGGRTGRDGIHGATFSSGELTSESETVSSGAVQIGATSGSRSGPPARTNVTDAWRGNDQLRLVAQNRSTSRGGNDSDSAGFGDDRTSRKLADL